MNTLAQQQALDRLAQGGGMLYPFRNGYETLAHLLDTIPKDAWRHDESVLGCLIIYLVKQGQTARAKSYLYARDLKFEKTYQFEFLVLLLELHMGEQVSERKLTVWRRLERELPLSDPLLLGLYYNCMMAMLVRIGRLQDARVAGQQAISCYREDRHVYLEHFIHVHLADMDVNEGRLHRAVRGLSVAERCLAQSGLSYGNEREVIEVIRLAVAYERGEFASVIARASELRTNLLHGDSWSELFFQLARVGVLSTYFTKGLRAAQHELEMYQADYVRRHAGLVTPIDVLSALIWRLEWNPNEAEQSLETVGDVAMHSSIGGILLNELLVSMGREAATPPPSPRAQIVAELQRAQASRGKARRAALERALRLAFKEGQIAPFVEHRDVFLGVSSQIASGPALRGQRHLLRMINQVISKVEQSYVIPAPLREIGFNRRQYRVAAALQAGATNKQVARQLGTTEATVKYHLTSLYQLAGVRRRTEFIDFIDRIEISPVS